MVPLIAWMAIAGSDPSPHSEATLVSSHSVVQAGKPFLLALRMKLDEGWHVYWKNPGDSGMPPSVDWKLPAGWKISPILWPKPHRIENDGIINYAYENEVLLLFRVTPGRQVGTANIKGTAKWLICREVCLTASEPLSLTLPVAAQSQESATWGRPLSAAEEALPKAVPDLRPKASRSGNSVRLQVTLPDSLRGKEGVQFFSADGFISPGAPQKMSQDGNATVLNLIVSEYSEGKVNRLKGLLVAPDGTEWREGTAAADIDVPLETGASEKKAGSAKP